MKSNEKLTILWFRWMGNLGMFLSLAIFLLYSSGLFRLKVEPTRVVANWNEEAPIYLEKMDLEFGNRWLFHIEDLYSMNVAAIAILVSAALPALFTLSFTGYWKRDFFFGTAAIAVFAVLIIATIGFQ